MIHDSYDTAPSLIWDAIRAMFSAFDRVTYGLLGIMYQLFFNVASSDILAGDTIMKFYSRVQLILGVFMMFQLAMIIIKGIVNPDSFTDSKTGIGNLIMRVCVSLFLLTSLVPINIPSPQNEYEKQLNNHGLLFGTLYSLQHRILENNTLGRLILGNTGESDNYVSTNGNYSASLEKSSRIFTSTILKTFYRINLLPDDQLSDRCKESSDPATINECRMCQSGIDHVIDTYKKTDVDPDKIISMVNETCTSNSNVAVKLFKYAAGTNRYALTYSWLLASITAIVFTFILISFTIDIAVRAIKLALLRLIAPIPIISYMDPKGSKDNAFNSWIKVLTSTYIDLFVRLAIVYFVLFLIEDIIVEGIIIPKDTSGVMKAFTYVAIFIGMFMFAKQAPKFIKQVLGLKDSDFKLFGGMSAAMGLGTAAVGAVGSFATGMKSSQLSDIERAKSMGMDEDQAKAYAGRGINRAKHLLSGIVGGAAGGATGVSAALNAKDHAARAAFDAVSKRNANLMSAGRNGGTFFGAVGSDIRQMAIGESAYDKMEAQWKADEQKIKNQELINKKDSDINAYKKAIMDRVNSKAVDNDKVTATYDASSKGYGTIRGNYRNWHSVSQAALTNGVGVRKNAAGEDVFMYDGQQIRVADISDLDYGMLDAAKEAYYQEAITNSTFDADIWDNKNAYEAASKKSIEAEFGGADGIKAKFGEENRRINKSNSELSEKRNKINEARQGYEGQKAQADSKRFRQNGK